LYDVMANILLETGWARACILFAAFSPELALAQVDSTAPAAAPPSESPAPSGNDATAQVQLIEDSPQLDAEADALIASLGDDSADMAAADVQEFKLNIYGFMDFTYTHRLNDFTFASPYPTFLVGNLNLYAGAELGDGWRTLTEFRLLYVPHGSLASDQLFATNPVRTDATVGDPADLGRPMRWGGVEIERAWLEYSAHPLFTIRGGQWLTPYGIWIVDHGSPVIIGVRRPFVVGEGLIPEHQTGVQIYGAQLVGTTELGYSLMLSNGRGPVDTYADLDHNKAVTGRLYVNAELPIGTLNLGYTLFRGNYTDRITRFAFLPNGDLGTEYVSVDHYEEFGMAADLRFVWEGLSVQSEVITREVALDDRFRAATLPLPGEPPGFQPDYRAVGFYVLTAYRLPWLNIMPFFGGETYDPGLAANFKGAAIWGGLNVRPTPRVVLKAQLTRSWASSDTAVFVGDDGVEALDLQAAWSF
jgi:hypothetical protein